MMSSADTPRLLQLRVHDRPGLTVPTVYVAAGSKQGCFYVIEAFGPARYFSRCPNQISGRAPLLAVVRVGSE